jgi:hypothetical protein
MRRSNWTPSIVPDENDRTIYLVADDLGEPGRTCGSIEPGRGRLCDRHLFLR